MFKTSEIFSRHCVTYRQHHYEHHQYYGVQHALVLRQYCSQGHLCFVDSASYPPRDGTMSYQLLG